jgi:hypothetical protein
LITGLIPGEYAVVVMDANGCVALDVVTVNAFSCVSHIESVFIVPSCFGSCDGAIGIVVLGGVGPFAYLWSTGDTAADVVDLCAGNYGLTVTDLGQGCSGEATFTLDDPEPLVVTIDQVVNITDTSIASISITVSGGVPPYAYAWIGPDGFMHAGEDISGMDAGFYSLTVADAFGCTSTIDSIEVRDETVGVADIHTLDVRLYPNPASSLVHLEVSDMPEYIIQLQSLEGRKLGMWRNVTELNVSQFAEGLYVLRCIAGEKQYNGLIVVNR